MAHDRAILVQCETLASYFPDQAEPSDRSVEV